MVSYDAPPPSKACLVHHLHTSVVGTSAHLVCDAHISVVGCGGGVDGDYWGQGVGPERDVVRRADVTRIILGLHLGVGMQCGNSVNGVLYGNSMMSASSRTFHWVWALRGITFPPGKAITSSPIQTTRFPYLEEPETVGH